MAIVSSTSSSSSRAASFLRSLPYPVTRALILSDLALAILFPVWGWWLARRWSGLRLQWSTYWPIYKRSLAFVWKHFRRGPSCTGFWSVAWLSPPVRHSHCEERTDHYPKGSCGTCNNCCTTFWLPPAEQVACPFLVEDRCSIYAGLCWDYFNCGRYPSRDAEIRVYGCARFASPSSCEVGIPESD